jgi:outer membrane protein assembly factor BamB
MPRLPGLWALVFAAGAWAQTPVPAVDPFEGTWVGRVIAPNATAEIGFDFIRSARGLGATFSMPAMFVAGMNLGPAHITDDTYALPALGIKLTRTGDVMTGTFANPLLRVELRRDGELPAAPGLAPLPAAPAPLWSRALAAKIWAAPVAAGGTVFVGDVAGKFHALRAADGSERWTWTGPNPLFGDALIDRDLVYFVDATSDVIGLSRADGALRWRVKLREGKFATVAADPNPTFNHRTPVPVMAGGTLYVGSIDHGLYALDGSTGEIRWRHEVGAPIYASVALDGNELIAGCFDGTVLRLDRRTGAELARVKLGGPIASAPVVVGETVIVGCRDYLLYGLKRTDLAVAWRDSFWFSWVESVPRVADGLIYVGGSDFRRVSALEPGTGATRWAADVRGLTWGSPVVTATTIFAGTSAQRPAAIAHAGGITALDRATGAVKWRHVTPLAAGADRAGYLGSLALADGKIIGAGYDGTVVAFPAN